MVGPFHSAQLKIELAQSHCAELDGIIRHYSQQQLAKISRVRTADGSISLTLTQELGDPPDEISVTVGDILFNYRSALDHIIWELVAISGVDPKRTSQFPIAEKLEDFEKEQPQWGDLTDDLLEFIKGEQVFNARYPFGDELLVVFEQIYNIDKHRHLLRFVGTYAGTFTESRYLQEYRDISEQLTQNIGHVSKCMILATIPSEYSYVPFIPDFTMRLALNEDELKSIGDKLKPIVETAVPELLKSIAQLVDDKIAEYSRRLF